MNCNGLYKLLYNVVLQKHCMYSPFNPHFTLVQEFAVAFATFAIWSRSETTSSAFVLRTCTASAILLRLRLPIESAWSQNLPSSSRIWPLESISARRRRRTSLRTLILRDRITTDKLKLPGKPKSNIHLCCSSASLW